uniref:Activin_recp domain-containing protein n=1 Tax=Haemonchus contortus TaxID=6289 RepID=A0A7I4YXS2_HAECO
LVVTSVLTSLSHVNGIRCFVGSDAHYTIVEETNSFVCSFKAKKACDFKHEEYNLFRAQRSSDICWFQHKTAAILCFCTGDLCNGNFTTLSDTWQKKKISNGPQYKCALDFLKSKISLMEDKAVPLHEFKSTAPTAEATTASTTITTATASTSTATSMAKTPGAPTSTTRKAPRLSTSLTVSPMTASPATANATISSTVLTKLSSNFSRISLWLLAFLQKYNV